MAGSFESSDKLPPPPPPMESATTSRSPESPLGKYQSALAEPQFYGYKSKDDVIQSIRKEANFEQFVANGTEYHQARQQAGLKPDTDVGFSGGEEKITEGIIQQSKYEQYLRDGMNYEDARKKSGFGPDTDPGIYTGGAKATEDSHRYQAWLKEQLRGGASYEDADKRANEEVAKARKSSEAGAEQK